MKMLFKGHSTRLEMLIEKIHSNKENHLQESDISVSSSSGSESVAGRSASVDNTQDINSVSSVSVNLESPKSQHFSESDDEELDSTDVKIEPLDDNDVLKPNYQDATLKINESYQTSDIQQFTCPHCPRLFKHKRSRDRHLKLHTGDRKYRCVQCESAFARSDHLKIHMKTHEIKKQNKIQICNKGYGGFGEQTHMKEKDGKSEESLANSSPESSLICFHCNEIFGSADSLQNHLFSLEKYEISEKAASPDSKAFCIYCFQEFPSATHMYDHVQICHRTVKDENYGQEFHQDFNISMTFQNISFGTFTQDTQTNFVSKRRKELHIESAAFKRKCCEVKSNSLNETFICACCYQQLPNFKSFLLHMETHVSATKNDIVGVCVLCGEEIIGTLNLSKHLFKHSISKLNDFGCCCACKKYFNDYEHLQKHLAEEHVVSVYKCSICNEMFDDKLTMKAHLNSKHTRNCDRFECNYCAGANKIFHDKQSAEMHLSQCHLDQFCFKQARELSLLSSEPISESGLQEIYDENIEKIHEQDFASNREHRSESAGSLSLQCAYCKEYCKNKNELQIHLKGHQISEKSKHKCNICDEVYHSPNRLASHKLIHCKIIDGNICVQCKATLNDIETFLKHQFKHNNGGKSTTKLAFILPSICIVCSQTLQSDMEIELHAKFHLKFLTEEVSRSCLKCPTNLDEIMENDRNQFPCNACLVSNDLKTKIVESSRDESLELQCYLCKKTLSSKNKLQVHLIEHNFFGINQFSCYVCSSVFTAAAGLQAHLLEHNLAEKPYQCSKCSSSFFFRAELDNHRYLHNFQFAETTCYNNRTCRHDCSITKSDVPETC
ncbi:zinc finger protein 423 homolog isoform X2 [Cylas formicarius]|uniref:zinc finger protein 423 homolog isoform X2 n=1 Tax=Cylas formicarius TaxID=197179 RepID=UPI002958AD49|nr:zinc finger protein 423 homolog isoform X2 [Cylas formicarius]